MPLAINQFPAKSFQLLDDSLDFLRRVLLPWPLRYSTLLNCQAAIEQVGENITPDRRWALARLTDGERQRIGAIIDLAKG